MLKNVAVGPIMDHFNSVRAHVSPEDGSKAISRNVAASFFKTLNDGWSPDEKQY
jgi:hypothetical protein